jgi:glucose/arabinose dehydrogenase
VHHLLLRLISIAFFAAAFAHRISAQGYSSEEAASKMQVADGLEVQLVAAEPLVRQPVAIEFDDQGRLWVVQYLQYPNPEGLKRVAVDRYSRTKYDRVPEPPPRGPKGADKITILEDINGDGRMDHAKDFVSGLNLTSGIAFGHGGVFVLNVPYLLFYPDKNRDDVPDTDPEVLLTGFGMEDAHSVANSLTWGPDGWLYGCQGSTVTANIRGIEFQQGVWRYHPISKRFELFCEGGGNSWGLDFDPRGRLLYSTNWGGNILLDAVQGGYYIKSFGKHGALHNPHAYGYFDHAPHRNFTGMAVKWLMPAIHGLLRQMLPQALMGRFTSLTGTMPVPLILTLMPIGTAAMGGFID